MIRMSETELPAPGRFGFFFIYGLDKVPETMYNSSSEFFIREEILICRMHLSFLFS